MNRYFQLLDDMSMPDRWFLRGPVNDRETKIDPRTFTEGVPVDVVGRLRIPLRQRGQPLEFTLADFGMPVVTTEMARRISNIAGEDVQRVPAIVEDLNAGFEILNVLRVVDCLDVTRSRVTYWKESDGRPEKIGQPRMVIDLSIDPARASGHHIFRIAGWKIALVISEAIAQEIQTMKGVRLQLVTP